MALKHQLRRSGARIPELNAAILGTRHDPGRIGRKGDREHEVLQMLASRNQVRRWYLCLTL